MATVAIAEALQVPPRDLWDQGDIVQAVYFAAFDKQLPAVLVTPACDLEHEKISLWTLVALFPDTVIARQIVAKELSAWGLVPGDDGLLPVSKNRRDTLEERALALITQRYPRYHWVPVALGESAAQVADFSCVTSLPAEELRAKAVRIASLRPSWREQLPARYAAYMGRIGTDDFEKAAVRAHIHRIVDILVRPEADPATPAP